MVNQIEYNNHNNNNIPTHTHTQVKKKTQELGGARSRIKAEIFKKTR